MHSSITRIFDGRFAPASDVFFLPGPSAVTWLLVVLSLPLASFAQDDRVTIVSGLSDGVSPAVAPKTAVTGDFEIRETVQHTLSGRKITIHRVKKPGSADSSRLPGPTPEATLPRDDASLSLVADAALSAASEEVDFTILMLSATVVSHRATLLSWNHEGRDYRAWSNLDFNDLAGFFEFRKGRRQVGLYLSLSDVDAASTTDAAFRIPVDLPVGEPTFRLIQGDSGDVRACEDVAALHELYRTDGARLRQARIVREQRAREQEAWLRAHPPVPQDVVLHYWKVQPLHAEGGAK